MIFKPCNIVAIVLTVALLWQVRCVRNPYDVQSGPYGNLVDETESVFSGIEGVVQDSGGVYYGSSEGILFRFDSSDLKNNTPPDTVFVQYPISPLTIDSKNSVIFSSYSTLYVLPSSGIIAEHFFPAGSDRSLYHADPLCIIHDTLWLASGKGHIFRWDGERISTCTILPDDNIARAVFPHDNDITVFTSNGFYAMSRFEFSDGAYSEYPIISDSCRLVQAFSICDRYFAIGEFFHNRTMYQKLFEINDDNTVTIFDTISYGYSCPSMSTDETVYLNDGHRLLKLTPTGLFAMNVFFFNDPPAPLFLDRNGRPTMFCAPSRKIIHLDSLEGFWERIRW